MMVEGQVYEARLGMVVEGSQEAIEEEGEGEAVLILAQG